MKGGDCAAYIQKADCRNKKRWFFKSVLKRKRLVAWLLLSDMHAGLFTLGQYLFAGSSGFFLASSRANGLSSRSPLALDGWSGRGVQLDYILQLPVAEQKYRDLAWKIKPVYCLIMVLGGNEKKGGAETLTSSLGRTRRCLNRFGLRDPQNDGGHCAVGVVG